MNELIFISFYNGNILKDNTPEVFFQSLMHASIFFPPTFVLFTSELCW